MPHIDFHYPALVKADYSQKVPFTIMYTFKSHDITEGDYNEIMKVREQNPEYEIYFYDNKECEEFLQKWPDILKAFKSIKPGPFKADIFRYIYLLDHGGLYLDLDLVPTKPLREIFYPEMEFSSCIDVNWFNVSSYTPIFQAMIASVPGHKYLKDTIDAVTKNVLEGSYKDGPLGISGPVAMGNAMKLNISIAGRYDDGSSLFFEHRRDSLHNMTDKDGNIIFKAMNKPYGIFPTYFRTYFNHGVYESVKFDALAMIVVILGFLCIYGMYKLHIFAILFGIAVAIGLVIFFYA